MIKESVRLRIALIQSPLHWENPSKNRAMFNTKIEEIGNTVDLIVLPEMFTTGFTMNPDHIPATESENTLDWMKNKANEKQVAIAGSIVYNEKGFYYNRLFFVEPNGAFSSYDKKHTFTLAGEHKKYKAGTEKLIVEYKGFKICPLVCYDLRFPVWSRNTEDYDILLYVANWPAPRINAWDTLLKARAIENMAFTIGVNRVGVDEEGHKYSGHSGAYDALGNLLSFSNKEETLQLELVKDELTQVRKKLRFLEDRDDFTLLN